MASTTRRSAPARGLGSGVPLGRIAAIEVRLLWTWSVAAVFIALSPADGVFPSDVGGLSCGTYAAMRIATTLLCFVTLRMHELGHAL